MYCDNDDTIDGDEEVKFKKFIGRKRPIFHESFIGSFESIVMMFANNVVQNHSKCRKSLLEKI
jgi:hypothetical protein